MNIKQEFKNKETWLRFLYIVLVFSFLFFLNQRTVFLTDDYIYSFYYDHVGDVLPNENTRRLCGIVDLLRSVINHYQINNGRIISHALIMFFLMFDKSVFNVCNSLMFVLVGLLILYHIETDLKKWRSWYIGVVYLMMWVCFPAFGASVLWVSGSCNYLWMLALTLIFLIPFCKYTNSFQIGKHQLLKAIGMIPLGLIAGNSKENGGGAMILLAILLVLYWCWKQKKVPLWSVTGILSAIVGFSVILLSPSNQARMSNRSLSIYLTRLREIIGFSYHYVLPLIILLALVVISLIKKTNMKRDCIEELLVPFLWCLAGASSVGVLLVSSIVSGRSWIWAVCFMLIAIGQICHKLEQKEAGRLKYVRIALVILVMTASIRGISAVRDINMTYSQFQEQIILLNEQKKQGVLDVVVPRWTESDNEYNAIYHMAQLTPGKNEYFNQWMALYYEVDSITGIER